MFENVIGHAELIQTLSDEVAGGKLPSSLLFHGPRNGAKLTTALELARVLTCSEDGSWGCSCPACRQHRTLSHPNTVMMGTRNFTHEIAASADVLMRTRKKGSQFLFLRAVRKLLRRFDPVVWEGNEPKFKKAFSSAEKIEELLDGIAPEKILPESGKLRKLTDDIITECEKIHDGSAVSSVSVAQVRRVGTWVHTSTREPAKVVIIDGADSLSESARNALLKTLEEPPAGVYFVLLSERRGAIIPTIVSRLRPYRFAARSPGDTLEVLRRIFAEESGEYTSIDQYFMAWSFPDLLRTEAKKFWNALISDSILLDDPSYLDQLSKSIADKKTFKPFLYELSCLLQSRLRSDAATISAAEISAMDSWSRFIHEALDSAERFNQSTTLQFESMFYKMRSIA